MTVVFASDRLWSGVALVVVALIAVVALRCRDVRERRVWIVVGVVLMFLAFSRYFHIASKVSSRFRRRARFDGWYEDRRLLQMIIVVLVALALVAALAAVVVSSVRAGSRLAMVAAVAVAVPVTVELVRMVSWHWSDTVLSHQLAGVTIADASRWIALIVVVAVTWWALRAQMQRVDLD